MPSVSVLTLPAPHSTEAPITVFWREEKEERGEWEGRAGE